MDSSVGGGHGVCNDPVYLDKVLKTYGELNGELHLVDIDRTSPNCTASTPSLGLCLAGNRDLATMSVFVVGFQSGGLAAADGRIRIGDELLEINGHVLFGRSHLNASAIIKSVTSSHLRLLLLRSDDFLERMAINPLTRPPVEYKDSSSTLIPKKSKSLSVDDAQLPDDIAKVSGEPCDDTSDVILPSSINVSCLANGIPANIVEQIGEGDVDECSAASEKPTDQNNVTSSDCHSAGEPTCHPLPSRSRHMLQKHAQVEDLAEDLRPSSPEGINVAAETHNHHAVEVNSVVANCTSPTADSIQTSTARRPSHVTESVESPDTSPDLTPHHVMQHGNTAVVHDDPTTCPIAPGRPTRISICKGKTGLGLKIIGGADTVLRTIVIYEIFDEGAAAKDDRLKPGDQILEVGGEDLRNATHSRAVRVLQHTLTDTLSMVVLRTETVWSENELHDFLTVDLVKKPGKGLGLSIVGRRHNTGVVIADIVRGGTAESDGRLAPGDQIVKVNGEDVCHMTQECTAAMLKTLMGKVSLTVARLKSGLVPGQRPGSGSGLKKSESIASDCKNAARQIPKRPRASGCYGGIECLRLRKAYISSNSGSSSSELDELT